MDKARSFEYVYRLPANTVEELSCREDVYDRQVLLNETWSSYATRRGRLNEAEDEHVKWITQTWDEAEHSRVKQRCVLRDAVEEGERQIAKREEVTKRMLGKSAEVVDHLMAFQEQLLAGKIPCRHNLFVDFYDLQQRIFIFEQKLVLESEHMLRLFIEECEQGLFGVVDLIGECQCGFCLMKLEERLRREEEERRRIAQEEQRAIEEERQREEMRRKQQEEAERLQKEALQQAKLMERKKREEARRAKARSERERLKHHQGTAPVSEPE